MADDKDKLVEYIDWSDRGLERHETGQHSSSFGNLDFDLAEFDLYLHLRRNTKHRRDFTIIIPHYHLKELYENLKELFEE